VPALAAKTTAVAFHRQVRGYAREESFAIGDSREDLACAAEVGQFWLVANGAQRDPEIGEVISRFDNVTVTETPHGAGVYEAVLSALMV
jgi:hydroxymethylpyrimidine pyrophosphatase-like HAD family hydrolase